jgi:hypothetical protein
MRRFVPAVAAALIAALPASVAVSAEYTVPYDFPTIQSAIDGCAPGDEIIVIQGTFNEVLDFRGKALTLRSIIGPEATTISGAGLEGSVLACVSGEGPDTIIEGFTIADGRGRFENMRRGGGGMYNRQSSPTVRDCIFLNNTIYAYEFDVSGSGGGMYNESSHPIVERCTFEGNRLLGCSGWLNGGAGMYNEASSPTLIDCVFRNNDGNNGGGVMNISNSHPTLANCVFEANVATFSGGGLNNTDGSSAEIVNSTFHSNHAYHGAALYAHGSTVDMVNCTVANNTAQWRAGGLYTLYHGSASTVSNCVFYGNVLYWPDMPPGTEDVPGDDEKELANFGGPAPVVQASIVDGGWAGAGVIDADPLFANATGGDFRLGAGSPAIDSGDGAALPLDDMDLDDDGNMGERLPIDLDHAARIAGATVDMGAFEAPGDGPSTCPADISGPAGPGIGDGAVNALDMLLLIAQWGQPNCGGCEGDITGATGQPDGVVDALDLLVVFAGWGMCD